MVVAELRSEKARVKHESNRRKPEDWKQTELCSGPAKLCQSLEIDFREHDGHKLFEGSDLCVRPGVRVPPEDVTISPRVGIDYAGPWISTPLRFSVRDSKFVSTPRPKVVPKTKVSKKRVLKTTLDDDDENPFSHHAMNRTITKKERNENIK